ncbi:hypothetical protein CDD83_8939 [Cordyceps sp. RAO-2017]|nr:hypothetical protein CDD83_8939 [Cordyceps sp. RAO-2017]
MIDIFPSRPRLPCPVVSSAAFVAPVLGIRTCTFAHRSITSMHRGTHITRLEAPPHQAVPCACDDACASPTTTARGRRRTTAAPWASLAAPPGDAPTSRATEYATVMGGASVSQGIPAASRRGWTGGERLEHLRGGEVADVARQCSRWPPISVASDCFAM